jgi:hypothetical protein
VDLEDEILKKVDEQYNILKRIIDEQKEDAKRIIRNLESVQSYKPPPQDLTNETFGDLDQFQAEVQSTIAQIEKDNAAGNFINVLKKKPMLSIFSKKVDLI